MDNKHRDFLIERAESLDWSVTVSGKDWSFNQHSPAGEDLWVEVEADENSVAAAVAVFSSRYDVDDHVQMWIGSLGKNGVPGTVRELLEDAEAIGLMYHTLGNALLDAEVEFCAENGEEDAE